MKLEDRAGMVTVLFFVPVKYLAAFAKYSCKYGCLAHRSRE